MSFTFEESLECIIKNLDFIIKMVKPKYNKIVISGGSVKGFAALGALGPDLELGRFLNVEELLPFECSFPPLIDKANC